MQVHRDYIVDNFGGTFRSWAASAYFNQSKHDFVVLIGRFYLLPRSDIIRFQNNGQLNATYTGFSILEIPAGKRLPVGSEQVLVYTQAEVDGV